MKYALNFIAILLFWSLSADPSLAQDGTEPAGILLGPEGDIYQASAKALTILLVLAVLIESALSIIFNWRVFQAYFSVSGVKTIINFAVSFLIVLNFNLDIVSQLFDIYTQGAGPGTNMGTKVLTALILAGGSSGVNKLLSAFGYRQEPDPELLRPKPPKDKAWISVRVQKREARSAVQVHVTHEPRPPVGLTAIAGTCLTGRPSLISLLMRNNDRFPSNGGYAVTPDTAYRISVSALGPDGSTIQREVTREPVMLAPGAIVDFDVTL